MDIADLGIPPMSRTALSGWVVLGGGHLGHSVGGVMASQEQGGGREPLLEECLQMTKGFMKLLSCTIVP